MTAVLDFPDPQDPTTIRSQPLTPEEMASRAAMVRCWANQAPGLHVKLHMEAPPMTDGTFDIGIVKITRRGLREPAYLILRLDADRVVAAAVGAEALILYASLWH